MHFVTRKQYTNLYFISIVNGLNVDCFRSTNPENWKHYGGQRTDTGYLWAISHGENRRGDGPTWYVVTPTFMCLIVVTV